MYQPNNGSAVFSALPTKLSVSCTLYVTAVRRPSMATSGVRGDMTFDSYMGNWLRVYAKPKVWDVTYGGGGGARQKLEMFWAFLVTVILTITSDPTGPTPSP